MTGFKPGDRVHERGHDHTPSTTGTVHGIQPDGTILVLWDDGPVITAHFPQHLEPLGEPMSTAPDAFFDAFAQPGSHNPETKAFESAQGHGRTLEVERVSGQVNLVIRKGPSRPKAYIGISLNPADAPALCLAILEATGWPEEAKTSVTRTILKDLQFVIECIGLAAKEAADRSKLESEAVQLLCKVKGWEVAPFASFGSALQTEALELACFARELHGVTA